AIPHMLAALGLPFLRLLLGRSRRWETRLRNCPCHLGRPPHPLEHGRRPQWHKTTRATRSPWCSGEAELARPFCPRRDSNRLRTPNRLSVVRGTTLRAAHGHGVK